VPVSVAIATRSHAGVAVEVDGHQRRRVRRAVGEDGNRQGAPATDVHQAEERETGIQSGHPLDFLQTYVIMSYNCTHTSPNREPVMPRAPLSKAEMEIARLVWELGRGTVRQVAEALSADRAVDYKTVQTFLRRLEAKGYIKSRRDGRSLVYSPRVPRGQVVRDTLRDLSDRLFGGEPLPLVLGLIEHGNLDREDLAHLRQLIDRLEREYDRAGR